MTCKPLHLSLEILLKIGTLLCTIGILLVVTLQAFARLYLPSAPAWTEEAARFLFLFSVAFAAPLALRDKAFVRVDALALYLPIWLTRRLHVAIDLAITLLMLTVSVASISFVKLGLGQRSPCLLLPMAWMHGVVLLLSVMTAWYAGMEAVEGFRQGGSREPEV